jgi:CubicO group peptidase (beta-lactamase class C family)
MRSDIPFDIAELDQYAFDTLRNWELPGLAIAVVEPNRDPIFSCHGLRDIGGTDSVTCDSVFAVGSLTKAFTATAIGMLVEEGRLHWDDPIEEHLPRFALAEPQLSRIATIRDLLAHRVGWDEDYWGQFGNRLDLSRGQLIRSLRFAETGAKFRAHFAYSNLFYLAAGEIVPAVTGQSWDDFLTERIFKALGMNSSSTRAAALTSAANHAKPHIRDMQGLLCPDPIRTSAWWTMDNHGPSGSINSTASDLSLWLRVHLDAFRSHKHLVSHGVLREMHRQHMVTTGEPDDGVSISLGYGLGWQIGYYRGYRCSHHEGAFRGFSAYAALLRDQNCGVAVLANSRDAVKGELTRAVGQWVLDRLLQAPRRDWQLEHRRAFVQTQQGQSDRETARMSSQIHDTKPSLTLPDYVGCYCNPAFAPWQVAVVEGRLVMRRSRDGEPYWAALDHWHYDTFLSIWNDPLVDYWPSRFISFCLDSAGSVVALRLSHEPGGPGSRFERVGQGSTTEEPNREPVVSV